ncbi:unnamed protein product [Hermetia illucens]|uniref:Uncharacterized protein n=1 Tax=Hermetia illucens TaxID=343691 RepID=A0A7R8UBS9_HERIL|nr:unnamed protein product [Hermetia illucens]
MIGPAVQGVLFVSVIYWYTKGMLNLINDYYRDEFKAFIDKDEKKESNPKQKEFLMDEPETCPAVHMEGLPDILKSTNELTKADGIVVRDIDKSSPGSPKCIHPPAIDTENRNVNSENIPPGASTPSNTGASVDPEKSHDDKNSISNPSKLGQSNYKQMTNQQVSDTDDGKSVERTSLNRNSGNCLENYDGSTDVPGRVPPNVASTSKTTTRADTAAPEIPKIAVNGVLVPADVLRKRLEEKLQTESCRRKSVHEMVQYWTNYLEAVDVAEQSANLKPSPVTKKIGSRTMPRAKSSGEIMTSARTSAHSGNANSS